MKRFILGFMIAMTTHETWGRVFAAGTGGLIAINWVLQKNPKKTYLLMLTPVLPVICFLLATYLGLEAQKWFSQNQPEQVAGDIVYYMQEIVSSAKKLILNAAKNQEIKTNPENLVKGVKPHYLIIAITTAIAVIRQAITTILGGFNKPNKKRKPKEKVKRKENATEKQEVKIRSKKG